MFWGSLLYFVLHWFKRWQAAAVFILMFDFNVLGLLSCVEIFLQISILVFKNIKVYFPFVILLAFFINFSAVILFRLIFRFLVLTIKFYILHGINPGVQKKENQLFLCISKYFQLVSSNMQLNKNKTKFINQNCFL